MKLKEGHCGKIPVLVWFGLVEVKLSWIRVEGVGLWDWQAGDKIVG